MKVCLAQLNPTVGDLFANVRKVKETVLANPLADLIIFPELFLTGYPPKDLLLRRSFLAQIRASLTEILKFSRANAQPVLVLGLPWEEEGKLFNSVVALKNGNILGVQHKRKLTRLRLFDESKYFSPGAATKLIALGDETLGLVVGWELDRNLGRKLKEKGATVLVNPIALPFRSGRVDFWQREFQEIAAYLKIPAIRVNQVGANDELIFFGRSLALDSEANLQALLPDFQTADLSFTLNSRKNIPKEEINDVDQIYKALVLGLRDYVKKSGMKKVIIGLSGGLDSALSAVIAAKALGAENVWGITLPGPHSPADSVRDAKDLAKNLDIRFDSISIIPLYETFLQTLQEQFARTDVNVAEENIQARVRGNLLMALSNKFGGLVLTNSNKSELAVGYCTLYGDMSGGLAVLGDVYKTMVYQLAHYINRQEEIIPQNTIKKPPSAELRPNQRDDDSLPPYEILDGIIAAYLDENFSEEEIIEAGFAPDIVAWVLRTIDSNDYKRRQGATILRVSGPIFGYDRQMPLAAKK